MFAITIRRTVLGIACFILTLHPSAVLAGPSTEIDAFGDSLTDVGNVFTLSLHLEPASPPYDNGRFSNGPLWVEQFASRLGLPTPTPSLLGGNDYAYGGAQTGPGASNLGFTPNIGPGPGTQIDNYLKANPTGFNNGQLIVVWGGANDFLNVNPTPDPSTVVNNTVQEITAIANAGGKNFLIPNLPPLGDTPEEMNNNNNHEKFNLLSIQFNNMLATAETNLEATRGIKIFPLDVHGLFEQLLANPGAFGFTNVTDQAKSGGQGRPGTVVANPDQYVYWDSVHPTAHIHQLLGDAAFNVVTGGAAAVPEPSSLTMTGIATALGLGSWLVRRIRKSNPVNF